VNRRFCLLLLSAAALIFVSAMPSYAQTVMTRHTREATLNGQAKLVGHLPTTQTMQLNIVLAVRDQAGLDAFVAALYNRYSPDYRHFLTPAQFTEKFGPTQQDYDMVVQYLKDYGLNVVGGSRDGMNVEVKGTVSAIESAFHVNMMTYQHPTENRVFYAPDREPSADLPFALWHISGLELFSAASVICEEERLRRGARY
jgi:kumamolisin